MSGMSGVSEVLHAVIECNNMEERLKELGDPSGKQTAEYWDEWFDVVCGEDHRPFEWYCDVEEVVRMLRYHCIGASSGGRMIHPGSGNSLVPVKLRSEFGFPHKHVVVDISDVALTEMRKVHDLNSSTGDEIEYLLGNVLEPPLPLDDSSFDVWVDKGLVDALFKDSNEVCLYQSQNLFAEASRLLRSVDGLLLVVTMAEKHSLQLILSGFWSDLKMNLASLHVWELEPVSGDMRPFGFVLHRKRPSNHGFSIIWHRIDNQVEEVRIQEQSLECLVEELTARCDASRVEFKLDREQQQDKTLATIEIKPWDAETDLETLKEIIVNTTWTAPAIGDQEERCIDPKWQAHDAKVVPIGYGVCKLVLQCTVRSDDIDALVDAISDWEGAPEIEDGVQSVDVDWTQTARIAAIPCIKILKSKE